MFGQANIIVPSRRTTITTRTYIAAIDMDIDELIEHLSTVDQTCQDYVLFFSCMATVYPCPGSAWCGTNSKDELRSAATSACRCDRTDSCDINLGGYTAEADKFLIAKINASFSKYYVGSSSTGPVGDNNLVCQDVTGKRHHLHACSLHFVVHGGAGSVFTVWWWSW